jgi:Rv2525c-like, glycoside hydrolase-like domain
LCLAPSAFGQSHSYFGFDRNEYPGDGLLPQLHHTFSFAGYWLNNPPGDHANSWVGKRATVKAADFGFLILFNGRLDNELAGKDAAALGRADGAAAVAAARREGFASGAVIFLDQEEGGRLLSEQNDYLFAWVKAVRAAGYRAGVYCSGIPVAEGSNKITTAGLIAAHDRDVVLWVVNDVSPPAPGCLLPNGGLSVASSGIKSALVWQYARSPRTEFARGASRTYAPDRQCYAPGLPHTPETFVDLNLSSSADPSGGR